jgi:hypothetical protein
MVEARTMTVLDREPTRIQQAVRRPPALTTGVGGFLTCMGGIHVGIVGADPETYRSFGEPALFGFVREGWAEVFMADPRFWGLLLAAAEITVGVLLLVGGRAARVGWALTVVFQLLLMLFGFWIWAWCLPAIAFLVWAARRDWPRLERPPAT